MPTMAVLLLSATMQPLNVISKRRLLILLGKERIALLDEQAEAEAEAAVRERRLPQGIVMARRLSWSTGCGIAYSGLVSVTPNSAANAWAMRSTPTANAFP